MDGRSTSAFAEEGYQPQLCFGFPSQVYTNSGRAAQQSHRRDQVDRYHSQQYKASINTINMKGEEEDTMNVPRWSATALLAQHAEDTDKHGDAKVISRCTEG